MVGKHSSNIAIQNLKVLWHIKGITVNDDELTRNNTIISLFSGPCLEYGLNVQTIQFCIVNVISNKIAVKKYSSPPETHLYMSTFHELRTFTLARDLFTKIFLEWLESYKKISLFRDEKNVLSLV